MASPLLEPSPMERDKAATLQELRASEPHIESLENTFMDLSSEEALEVLKGLNLPDLHAVHRHLSCICCRLAYYHASSQHFKDTFLQYATAAARNAYSLAPKRTEHALHLAQLLAMMVDREPQKREEIIDVCKAALAVRDPSKFPVWLYSHEERNLVSTGRQNELLPMNREKLRELLGRYETNESHRNDGMAKKLSNRKKIKEKEEKVKLSELTKKVEHFWKESMSDDQRRDFFKVGVEDLKNHCSGVSNPSKSADVLRVLSEAMSVLEERGTFTCWICFRCSNLKFSDASSYTDHRKQNHSIPTNLQSLLPVEIDQTWKDIMLINRGLQPIDVIATKGIVVDNELDDVPISDDQDRIELLDETASALRSLIYLNGLCKSYLKKIIDFVMEEIRGRCAGETLVELQVDKMPICLRLLEAPELQKVLIFLQEILDRVKKRWPHSNYGPDSKKLEYREDIYLDRDTSTLVLDATMFCDTDPNNMDVESMMSWLYDNGTNEQILAKWASDWERKVDMGIKMTNYMGMGYSGLDVRCRKKLEILTEMSAEKDLDVSEDCWTIKDYLSDDRRVKKLLAMDEGICRELKILQYDEDRLLSRSAVDYKWFVLLLMKSFMKCRLEDLMNRDAMERSEAATLELLKTCADENNAEGGKTEQKLKTKKKKKNKKKKKGKGNTQAKNVEDGKGTSSKTLDEDMSASSSDEDHQEPQQVFHNNPFEQEQEQVHDRNEAKLISTSSSLAHEQVYVCDNYVEELCRKTMEGVKIQSSSRHDEHKPDSCQQEKQDVEDNLKTGDYKNDEINRKQEDSGIDGNEENSGDIEPRDISGNLYSLTPKNHVKDAQDHLTSGNQSNLPTGDSLPTSEQILDSKVAEENPVTIAENHSFFIAAIQSLWHFPRLSFEISTSPRTHVHIGEPCATCELVRVFFDFITMASKDNSTEPMDVTGLCSSFHSTYSDRRFFQEADASEISDVLEIIYDSLHRSLNFPSCEEQKGTRSYYWDCIVAAAYGMNVYENINHPQLALCTRFAYYAIPNLLYPEKVELSYNFDEILERELVGSHSCNLQLGGCTHTDRILQEASDPHQPPSDTSASCPSSYMQSKPSLVSLICSDGHSYCCFGFHPEQKQWLLYLNDAVIKVIGCGHDVISMCKSEKLMIKLAFFQGGSQPQNFLFDNDSGPSHKGLGCKDKKHHRHHTWKRKSA